MVANSTWPVNESTLCQFNLALVLYPIATVYTVLVQCYHGRMLPVHILVPTGETRSGSKPITHIWYPQRGYYP